MDFSFSRDECLNLERSLRVEWLETDGLGGYAASTILDCHSRKYHGLLTAPVPDAGGTYVLLSKVEAAIITHGNTFRFSTNKYPGVFDPTGHKYIEEFHHEYHPTVLYRVGELLLRRSVMMVQGEHTLLLKYELHGGDNPVTLQLRPLLAYRNMHQLSHENGDIQPETGIEEGHYRLAPYNGLPPLFLDASRHSDFRREGVWLKSMEYLKERSRGFEYQEDLFVPGTIELEVADGDIFFLRASLQPPAEPAEDLWNAEHQRREQLHAQFQDDPKLVRVLKARAEQFIIRNARGQTSVLAGYPWFGEWARDAMIAVPGLTLNCGRPDRTLAVLTTFAAHCHNGLLPNILPLDREEPSYNSIDAPLWMFWAVQKYLAATADGDQVDSRLFPTLERIIKAYADSEPEPVNVMDNGLLWVGDENTQLTWMDARVEGKPVTPRHGMAVEINALWYNALCFYLELCDRFGHAPIAGIADLRDRVKSGFVDTFWLPPKRHLADVVNNRGADDAVRPNQIFAVSLPCSALSANQKQRVIQCAVKNLVTQYGLRTLSPGHPDYCPIYHGTPAKRDLAYHQGTVWPWLIGHFVEGALAVSEAPEEEKKRWRHEFAPLFDEHLRIGCLGGISEIFNADPPHIHKGCITQAWSVAEAIRAWDLLKPEDGA